MDYTKGEWQIDGTTVYALNKRGNNRFFTNVQHGDIDSGAFTSKEELIANAQLISASPDMYLAGQELDCAIGNAIIEIAKHAKLDNEITEIILQYIVPAQLNWRKALAKAEGKVG